MANNTKQRFADAIVEMMQTIPVEKITVKQICERCQERRQTFYYHFKDIFDLMTWIYYQDAVSTIEACPNTPWNIVMARIFEKMDQKRAFYKNAFSDNGQNALIHSILEHEILLYSCMLRGKESSTDIWEDDLRFSIEYHSRACVYVTKQWLESKNPLMPSEIADKVYQNMPEPLKNALMQGNIHRDIDFNM